MGYYNPAFILFGTTFGSFVLLVLVSLSTPLIKSINFLHATVAGTEVHFGALGYCQTSCSSLGFGYHFETQIKSSSTSILVLFPVAAGTSLLLLLALFPMACSARARLPHFVISLLALGASASSIAAFVVSVYIFASAMSSFSRLGDSATLGPAVWMSLAAAVALTLVAVNTALGTCLSGQLYRKPSYEL